MITSAIIFLIISLILFIAALHNGLAILKPGFYPPKKVLKSRAIILGCAGGILLFIGIVIFYFF